MATRAQRRKDKHKRKRKAKKDQQRKRQESSSYLPSMPPVADSPHMRRIAQQQPQAWPDELREDVAVFDDAVLEALPAELQGQVTAVREALQLACDSRGAEGLELVAGIARTSPLSQWRLFLRGFVAWQAEDPDAASEAWKRLDFQRRPGRMAVALMNSRRSNLQDAPANEGPSESSQAVDGWSEKLDDQLLYHAKLLRRVRFERTALRIAEAGVKVRDELRELTIGEIKIRWLKQFVAEHRSLEPSLTAALQQVALDRAMAQPFVDLFEMATKAFEGPKYDRRNLLRAFFYYARFEEDRTVARSEQALKEYLEKDLPNNEELPEPLRGAIASQIHLEEARMEITPPLPDMLSFFATQEDAKAIRYRLNASVKAYPANRAAYKTHVDWLEAKLDDERLTKARREPLLRELAGVMEKWSRALPDDAQPRLWLLDYLLEHEQTEEAKPHVEWLAASRHDDPRVRAAPWKWQLLEAMRLCRRKARVAAVPAHLDEAERLWPAWLSQQWLPYLRAGLALRAGDNANYEIQRQEIEQHSGVKRDSLPDACMILAAAQHMRFPSANLKVLRAPVDDAVRNLRQIPDEELLAAASFFWDLHRTKMLYPAYRMHGGKFVKELFDRMGSRLRPKGDRLSNTSFHAAFLLFSEHRFMDDGYYLKLPAWSSDREVKQHPMFAAAQMNTLTKIRFPSGGTNDELGPLLRNAAQSERDSYYRYWFTALADEVDENIADESRANGFNPLDFMFGGDEDEDEFDLGFDPDCNCPSCRAARKQYESSQQ